MMRSDGARVYGIAFAFAAATCNGTVHVLSRFAFDGSFGAIEVAFCRCMGALLLFTLVAAFRPRGITTIVELWRVSWQIGICAALGLFTLYYFETTALTLAPVPYVAVLVFAGGLGALFLNVIFLGEKITVRSFISILLVVGGGCALVFSEGATSGSFVPTVYALIAGFAYACFLFFWKLFKLESSPAHLWWFFFYGGLFLFVPYAMHGARLPEHRDFVALVALSVLPSFCGFYFTVLALQTIEAYKTQIIGATEPVFSCLFAFIFLHELSNVTGIIGAIAVIVGSIIVALPGPLPNHGVIGGMKIPWKKLRRYGVG